MQRIRFHKALGKHKDRVYSYALYLCRNRDDADDITQEVFVKLWHHWDNIDHQKLQSWIMRVTHNSCMDYIRRRKVVEHRQTGMNHADKADTSWKSNPEQVYEKEERQRQLMQMMETLPVNTKSILLLHYFQGHKLDMIAEILEMNVNTVKVTLHRGRKMLKTAIEGTPEMAEALGYE